MTILSKYKVSNKYRDIITTQATYVHVKFQTITARLSYNIILIMEHDGRESIRKYKFDSYILLEL